MVTPQPQLQVQPQQPAPSSQDEALKRNTDCVYFLASPLTCKKVLSATFFLFLQERGEIPFLPLSEFSALGFSDSSVSANSFCGCLFSMGKSNFVEKGLYELQNFQIGDSNREFC